MIAVVFDANAVIAGCAWTGEAQRCLVNVARRKLASFVTPETLGEWKRILTRLEQENIRFGRAPWPCFHWLVEKSKIVEPAPLGKQRSRDPKDDPYLACALAARADYIVTRDKDLLVMEKPFGIEIVTPREILTVLLRVD